MYRVVCMLIVCSIAVQAQDPGQLFSAIRRNDIRAVEELLNKGIDPNSRNGEGATALMYAAHHGDLSMMKLLLKSKAEPNGKGVAGATALMWAAGDPEKVRLLLEHGADATAKAESGRTPLIIAATYDGNLETVRLLLARADPRVTDRNGDGPVGNAATARDAAILRELLAKGGNPQELVRSGGNFFGYSPLMRAVQANCVECIRVLLDAGAEIDTVSDAPRTIQAGAQASGKLTALLLAAPYGNTGLVRPLLERGASIDVKDARGMTPLMLAVTSETQNADVVRLLLAKGAAADVTAADGQSALGWARKWGADTEISRLLVERGAKPDNVERQVAPDPKPSGRTPKEAVEHAIALLQSSGATYLKKAGCEGCHHQLLTGILIGAARDRGISLNETLASEQRTALVRIKQRTRDQLLERLVLGVSPIENALGLVSLSAQEYAADSTTDALWHDIAGLQKVEGSWSALNQRPPIVYSAFTATAYAVRALSLYASPGRKAEMESRIRRARSWLTTIQPAAQTEERAMQLLGLYWSGADRSIISERAKILIGSQKPDGGWSQREGFSSDAYATGQALYALHVAANVSNSDPVFRRGVEYLLRTQHEDGSWYVRSRSVKFQPYFESGFPYGHDQWISAAGTNWAAMALTFAVKN